MLEKTFLRIGFTALVVSLFFIDASVMSAANSPGVALTGQVSSQEEGRMEGVLVSAKRESSTVTTTVMSDAQGRYSFPSSKLEPGRYSLRIRAVGYELDNPESAEVKSENTTQLDLKLRKAQGSSPMHRQVRPGVREPSTNQLQQMTKFAQYLSTINLSKVAKWEYPLKTLPRPKGKSTQVMITEYDLPRPEAMPHDAAIDAQGMVWYSDFGSQYLGKLDPKTAKAVEYAVPVTKPGAPAGALDLRFDPDQNVWIGMMYQGSIAKFDRKTEKFQTWSAPKFMENDEARLAMVDPVHINLDGKVWIGGDDEFRLDVKTGEWYTVDYSRGLPKDGPPADRLGSYGVISDSKNNFYGTNFGGQYIIRIDAKTLNVTPFPTPTPNSAPRRGHMDPQDRLWFAEYRGNMIGMFDTKTERTREWAMPTEWTNPYDAILDKDGYAWTGGMSNDLVARLNTKTDEFVEYLLPRTTNIRRVNIDYSTNRPTLWIGNNLGAAIIKIESLQ